MSQQFEARKAKPQKTGDLIVSGLLQRSHTRASEHDQNPKSLDSNTPHTLQASRFSADFSQVSTHTSPLPIQPKLLQPKLQVGRPGDQYEQEADRMADRVMSLSSPAVRSVQPMPAIGRIQRQANDPLQRQPAAEEEKKKVAKGIAHKAEQKKQQAEKEKVVAEETAVKADKDKHSKEKKKKEDEPVQTQPQPGKIPVVTPSLENHLSTRQGGGQALPETTRRFMESRFQHDFSQVRVHRDTEATQALNARAFTRRNDIFFNPTQYQPEAPHGKHLLAHELTHVVQQGAAPARSKSEIS
jgi:hypothetical protein